MGENRDEIFGKYWKRYWKLCCWGWYGRHQNFISTYINVDSYREKTVPHINFQCIEWNILIVFKVKCRTTRSALGLLKNIRHPHQIQWFLTGRAGAEKRFFGKNRIKNILSEMEYIERGKSWTLDSFGSCFLQVCTFYIEDCTIQHAFRIRNNSM